MANGAGGRPPKYRTAEELQAAIDAYFDSMKFTRWGEPIIPPRQPTIAGLAYALGFVDRQSIYDMEDRGDEFSCVLKKARLGIIDTVEERTLMEGKAGQIFWLKNNAGYKDTVDQNVTMGGQVGLKVELEFIDD